MSFRILTASDVRAALTMPDAIAAMRVAFGEFSAGRAEVPLRSRLASAQGVTLVMPALMADKGALGVKIVSIFENNPTQGLPTVTAAVLVLDPASGVPLAVMDGTGLTALRTGAAGGLATDLLARRDAAVMALFGAGVQARTQLAAVRAVRDITRVNLVDPDQKAAMTLMAEVATSQDAPAITYFNDADAAVAEADIVAAATTARKPVFDGRYLRAGTHVTGVGSFTPEMQEIDAETIRRARIVVDSREACRAEAGDLIVAGVLDRIAAEIGEIVNGQQPARRDDEEITYFKSVGLAVQDAAAAAAVLKAAQEKGLGSVVELTE
jgi:ornithine cyclodeaminase/alanine dehydrogenase-like protein (mu-crystallin family)